NPEFLDGGEVGFATDAFKLRCRSPNFWHYPPKESVMVDEYDNPSNTDLRKRLKTEINTAEGQQRVKTETMYLVEALHEIERLNEALMECGHRVEELYHFINERRGERVA